MGIEKVVKINQYGANLVLDEEPAAKLFGSIGIDETKTAIAYGDYMDRQLLESFGHYFTLVMKTRKFWTLEFAAGIRRAYQ